MENDNAPTPNNEYDYVAFELQRALGSIEYLNNRVGGRLKFARDLVKQALDEIDEVEAEESDFN